MSGKQKDYNNTIDVATLQLKERATIRWMIVFYDFLVLVLCWLGVVVMHPSVETPFSAATCVFYLVLAELLFFVSRLMGKSYKCILRYGSMHAFSRETLSGFVGGVLFVFVGQVLGNLVDSVGIPFSTLVSFSALYVLASIVIRILYCYLYWFATKDGAFFRLIRRALEVFGFVDFDSKTPGATLHLALESGTVAPSPINEIQNIAEKFAIRGDITRITQINKGYINRTYRLETLSDSGHVHKYILQRINTNVFPDVEALMSNFKLTTDHLYGKLHLPGQNKRGSVQTLRPTKDGRAFLQDASGCWRVLTYFDDVYSLDIPDNAATFYQAGRAFGNFIKEMSDVPVEEIKEVIPGFHDTGKRYLDLEHAIEADPKGRVKGVQPEIAFIRERKDRFGMISQALDSGKIPTRICHNDCNLNNILFDKNTDLPVAIIDLDTVMPSTPLYDFGDSMRIGTNTAKDDEKDLSKVSCNLELYEQYARGYLEMCGEILTAEELELLPYAALVITSEDGIRFLMDHINGDTYYNIYYPGQNLDRARTQLKLVADMESKLESIKKIHAQIYEELGLSV